MWARLESARADHPQVFRNWRQLALLTAIVFLVGGMVGLERSVIPIYGNEFGLSRQSLMLFLVAFGLSKGVASLVVGDLSDRFGRRAVLLLGWAIGLPTFVIITFVHDWNWVIVANVFLGMQQGLCWSTSIIAMVDLSGRDSEGSILGLNEFSGYSAVAVVAFSAGYHVHKYHDFASVFAVGIVFAVAGLALSFFVEETLPAARAKAALEERRQSEERHGLMAGQRGAGASTSDVGANEEAVRAMPMASRLWWAFTTISFGNTHVFACCQAGFFSAFKDGIVWGLIPVFFGSHNLGVHYVSLLVAVYPMTWAVVQLFAGALYDKYGAKWLVATGCWLEGFAVCYMALTPALLFDETTPAQAFALFLTGSVILGVGTALMYPTLHIAVAHGLPQLLFAQAIGIYKLWREIGYAVGAVAAGAVADAFGVKWALVMGAVLVSLSGVVAAVFVNDERDDEPVTLKDVRARMCGGMGVDARDL